MSARWLAPLVVGLALLAGCSEPTPASDTLPPLSSPTTAATTPTPTLAPLGPVDLPVPDEARQETAAGAEAFLRWYLSLINRSSGTDGQSIRDLSLGCDLCTFLATRSDEDAAAGYVITGAILTITSLNEPILTGDNAEIIFVSQQSAATVVDSSGTPVPGRGDVAYGDTSSAAALTWEPDRMTWVITQLVFE